MSAPSPLVPRPEPASRPRSCGGLLTFVWALLLATCFAAPVLAGDPDPGDAFTRNTARLTVACYGLGVVLMTLLRGDEWRAAAGRGRWTRWCWTLGVAAFFIHMATAYHFVHHWSHTDAVRHTREVSGVGEGIYVSHFFGWLWLLDAVWWQAWPHTYAARPAWLGGLFHAFMAFMVFNATVVYEQGPIRWAGAALFLLLGAMLLRRLGPALAARRRSGIPREGAAVSPPR